MSPQSGSQLADPTFWRLPLDERMARFDLVEVLSQPFPLLVVCDTMGIRFTPTAPVGG